MAKTITFQSQTNDAHSLWEKRQYSSSFDNGTRGVQVRHNNNLCQGLNSHHHHHYLFVYYRDQKTVFVGDTRGRVFSWSVAEQPGRTMADHWLRDEGAESCVGCGVKFNIYERKHHCRNCGQVFCSK